MPACTIALLFAIPMSLTVPEVIESQDQRAPVQVLDLIRIKIRAETPPTGVLDQCQPDE